MSEDAIRNLMYGAARVNDHSDDSEGVFVSSVREANLLLNRHSALGDARYRRQLIDFITNPENEVFAACDVYHNLLMDLFRLGEFAISLKLCDFVLKFSPNNRDILGDALKACGESNQFDRGDKYMRIAEEIPMKHWTYRLFLYSIDFLKEKLEAFPTDIGIFEKAYKLCNEYIDCFPYDEHGYNQRAELLIAMNKREDAIADLKHFILEIQPDPGHDQSTLICAQCCVTLLNLLDDSSDYDFIISICDAGLRHTSQEQPSANIGYFMYRKALALDAKAHREEFIATRTLLDAMRCYQSAYDLNQDRGYAKTIERRYAVLRPHAEDIGYTKPLIRRPLAVDEAALAPRQ